MSSGSHRPYLGPVCILLAVSMVSLWGAAGTSLLEAQERVDGGVEVRVAVIDVQRLLAESTAGREVLDSLRSLRDEKQAELEVRQQEVTDLRDRLADAGLSLSEEKLEALEKELEERVIDLSRYQDEVDRELQKVRDDSFAEIENQIMPIITQAGEELGFTVIFKKYQSGLLFARQEIDVTDIILQRYDAAQAENEEVSPSE